ncbi:MAG: VCBS repeat-containing protein [Chitinophagaceae bacterium]
MSFFKKYWYLFFIGILPLCIGCNTSETTPVSGPAMFELLESKQTGLDFNNKLTPTGSFNIFKYMYFYNGAGVGAADFNNDGKIDLFFASNQGQNKMYLNQGGLKFKEITQEAKIPADGGWSTGVSVVDINNDGLLDIYVCKVGNFETLHGKNQLLVCKGIDKNGIPFFEDEAAQYGLDFSGFSTQAAFLDYDGDGDLDLFLVNHSVHQNGNFAPRKNFLGTYSELSGDRIFRNDGAHFTDVTKAAGINSSAISYGLGVCVADINLDGWPDIYIGNDFHENDYLYINQHDGTFKDEGPRAMMHTSQFSMGVDVADVNNDGFPEIISMDMLPEDPFILKRSLGEDNYDLFYEKIGYGYHYQYTRNNFQLNLRNGQFSEVGLYAGIAATDWSWTPLWMDFDNDGVKDLFISNGIPRRLNDIDFQNFITNEEIQKMIKTEKVEDQQMVLQEKFPQIKLPNKFYKNTGNAKFSDCAAQIKNDKPTYSNGAVYADLDNDGDLDVIVNNIDDPAMLYENHANDKKDKPYAEIKLKGPEKNPNAVGARIFEFSNGEIRVYEKNQVRGFLSSMETPLHIGLDKAKPDSVFLVWPDNHFERITLQKDTLTTLSYKPQLPVFDYRLITEHWKNPTTPMFDITQQSGLTYLHKEDFFHEFDREQLLPHMLSTEGPGMAIGDINHDGLDDVFIGAARFGKPAVFLQQGNGHFVKSNQPALDLDSNYETVSACFADINRDGFPDLVVASAGNEFYGDDEHNSPHAYLNDGKGNFSKKTDAFSPMYLTASCIVPCDFDGDGFIDLFMGGRAIPWEYGQSPTSYLLKNDGKGHFINVTQQFAAPLANIGFVTNAVWCDLDNDKKTDLVLSLEWGGITAFMNKGGTFEQKQLTNKSGWWNFVLPVDLNGDGHLDFVCGNLGLNSRLTASEEHPVKLYYNDFDDNGKKEQVLTYFINGREFPFANIAEIQKQMPILKKKFLYSSEFAKATLPEIFTSDKLNSATVWKADYFSNAVLMNDGKNNFTVEPLPWKAQLAPYRDAQIVDANGDNLPDILLVGNYYENNIEMGRYDADYGTILLNKGNGKMEPYSINGLQVKGQVRHVGKIMIGGKQAFILARNNDSTMVVRFAEKGNEK